MSGYGKTAVESSDAIFFYGSALKLRLPGEHPGKRAKYKYVHFTLETAAPIRSSNLDSAASLSSLPLSSTDDVEAHEKVGPVALAPSEISPPLALLPLEAAASNSGVVSSLTRGQNCLSGVSPSCITPMEKGAIIGEECGCPPARTACGGTVVAVATGGIFHEFPQCDRSRHNSSFIDSSTWHRVLHDFEATCI